MTRSIRMTLIGSAAALIALPALAQSTAPAPTDAPPQDAHAHSAAAPSNATEANHMAMQKMQAAMMAEPTGDADVDFVRHMIPHHQGAIDMARIQLQFGDDPELRKMSEDIIRAQEAEIATMQDWLQKNAPDVAAADAARTGSPSADPATGKAPEPKPMTAAAPEARPAPGGTPEAKPAN